jgi:hypothetical protein
MVSGKYSLRILAFSAFAILSILSGAQNENTVTVRALRDDPRLDYPMKTVARQNRPVIELQDVSGVDCSGATDSSAVLNALTGNPPASNNSITGRVLSFGSCRSIQLRNTWLIKNQAGFIIDGMTRSGAAGQGARITWAGPASGIMMDMEYVDGFTVRGLDLQGSSNGGVGIRVDKSGVGGIWNTTDGRFADNSYSGTASNWIGLSISPVSRENVEDMRVENSSFRCNAAARTTQAVAVLIGSSPNAKNEIIHHINATGCFYGVWQKNGSIQVRESEFTSNGGECGSGIGADIRIDNTTDVDIIEGNLDENGTQGINQNDDAAHGASPGHPVLVRGNHAAPAGCENKRVYWYNTGRTGEAWLFEGDSWDADLDLVKVIGTDNGTGGRIYTRAMLYPNSTFVPWWRENTQAIADDLGLLTDNILAYAAKTGSVPAASNNFPSPYSIYRGYLNGSSATADDIAIQNVPASGGAGAGGTFLIQHQQGSSGTEMFGWDGSYPGIGISAVPTPSIISVTQRGKAGTSRYTYAVVAYGPVGHTAGSALSSIDSGNDTLTTTNYNQIEWYPVAGATRYCIWRTASAGRSISTGNIGCISALQVKPTQVPEVTGYSTNISPVTNQYFFHDTGLKGDFSTLPDANTTGTLSLAGQISSSLPTGVAPLTITSTTPVPNLTLMAHPRVFEAGVLQTLEKIYTNTQALIGGAAVHTFGNGFSYTSPKTFGCTCTDQTAANPCKAVPNSSVTVSLAGTGADVIWLECLGH